MQMNESSSLFKQTINFVGGWFGFSMMLNFLCGRETDTIQNLRRITRDVLSISTIKQVKPNQ